MAKAKTSEMTPQDKINKVLADWSAVEKRATEGPWHSARIGYVQITTAKEPHHGKTSEMVCMVKDGLPDDPESELNGLFIARSRDMVPKLIEAVRVLSEACEQHKFHSVVGRAYKDKATCYSPAANAPFKAADILEGANG